MTSLSSLNRNVWPRVLAVNDGASAAPDLEFDLELSFRPFMTSPSKSRHGGGGGNLFMPSCGSSFPVKIFQSLSIILFDLQFVRSLLGCPQLLVFAIDRVATGIIP